MICNWKYWILLLDCWFDQLVVRHLNTIISWEVKWPTGRWAFDNFIFQVVKWPTDRWSFDHFIVLGGQMTNWSLVIWPVSRLTRYYYFLDLSIICITYISWKASVQKQRPKISLYMALYYCQMVQKWRKWIFKVIFICF